MPRSPRQKVVSAKQQAALNKAQAASAQWRDHVAEVRRSNPGMSFKDALSEASKTYDAKPRPVHKKNMNIRRKSNITSPAAARRLLHAAYAAKYPGDAARQLKGIRRDASRANKKVLTLGSPESYKYGHSVFGPLRYDIKGIDDGTHKGKTAKAFKKRGLKSKSPKRSPAKKRARKSPKKQVGGGVSPAAARAAFTRYWRARLNNASH